MVVSTVSEGKGRRRTADPAMIADIAVRWMAGHTYRAIAVALQVTRGVVAGIIHRHLRPRDVTPTDFTFEDEVVELPIDESPAVRLDADQMTRILVAPAFRERIIRRGRAGLSVEEISDELRVPLMIAVRVLRSESIEPIFSTYVVRVLAALRVQSLDPFEKCEAT